MTPVGHSLVGLSLGVLGLPRLPSRRAQAAFLGAFVVLASIPDLPFPGWGHERYEVSHSVFVNLAILIPTLLALRARPPLLRAIGGGRAAACGAMAWFSHFLLDSLYRHGKGIAIYWPFSPARLNLPLPWFQNLTYFAFDWPVLRIFLIEALFYGPLLAACVAARWAEVLRAPEKAG